MPPYAKYAAQLPSVETIHGPTGFAGVQAPAPLAGDNIYASNQRARAKANALA